MTGTVTDVEDTTVEPRVVIVVLDSTTVDEEDGGMDVSPGEVLDDTTIGVVAEEVAPRVELGEVEVD